MYEPAHSDYTICTQDGKVLKHVRNSRDPNDTQPAMVPLAPGKYEVKAQTRDWGVITVPVVVEAGKPTIVNLQRGQNPVVESVARSNAVSLDGYLIVGWRAKGSAWPDSQ